MYLKITENERGTVLLKIVVVTITKKLSYSGRLIVDKQLNTLGWKKYTDRFCIEAGKLYYQKEKRDEEWPEGAFAPGCSRSTWEKFLNRGSIEAEVFDFICEVLRIDPAKVAYDPKIDWGQAPDLETFHGRDRELADLIKWIVEDRCRLISIVGFAGIGKSSLARAGIGKTKLSLKLAHQVEEEFDYIIWRKLDGQAFESLLKKLIKFVSDEGETELATTTGELTTQLLGYLKERRCLLIFDNIESIEHGDRADGYQEEYEDFFHCIGTSEHSSCVLLTSRVKFSNLERMEGSLSSVQSLELKGLDLEAGRKIFQDFAPKSDSEFQGTEEDWQDLISLYEGNPLALEIVARHIHRMYGGNLAKFLKEDLKVLKDIRKLFNLHFECLTSDEETIIYWLALNREGRSMDKLKEYLVFDREKSLLPQTLEDLERKIPIEKSGNCFTLHSLLMEYVTERVIEKVCEELTSRKLRLFNSHALIQASAPDYIKKEQIRLILQPIIDRLKEYFGLELENSLENRLPRVLKNLNRQIPGYRAGNLINLMRYAGIPIKGYDFSRMTIWEADLDTNLQNVNFAGCKFARYSFIKNFNWISEIAFHPQQDLIAVAQDRSNVIQLLSFDGQINLAFGSEDELVIGNSELAFSPDGSLLASTSFCKSKDNRKYNIVKLWDTDTGNLYRTFTDEANLLSSILVAFSPDGQTVAISTSDSYPTFVGRNDVHSNEGSIINLWDIHTNEHRILESQKPSRIYGIKFHPRENLLACAYSDTFCMWNTATEKLLYTLDNFTLRKKTFDFHPAGKILVIGHPDGTIKTLDAKTGKVLKSWKGHTKYVSFVSFGGDGQRIVSVGQDGKIKVWNAETEECLKTSRVDVRDGDFISGLIDFTLQKNILAIYHHDRQLLKLWNVDTEKYLKIWQGYSNIDIYNTVAISPDARTIASCSTGNIVRSFDSRTIRVWDSNGKLITWKLNRMDTTRFGPDCQTLIGSYYNGIELRDVKTGKPQKTFKHPLVGGILLFKYSADGRFIAGYNIWLKLVVVWDVETEENWSVDVGFCSNGDITLSYDGQYLASSKRSSRATKNTTNIKIWNVKTGESHRNLVFSLEGYIRTTAFHPNNRVLIAWEGKLIIFWQLETGESKSIQIFENYNSSVHDLFFDEEGNTFIVSSIERTIEIWQIDTAEMWSADTAARRIRVLEGHSSFITRVKATPNGRNLVSCDEDGVILRWDLETPQTPELIHYERPYEGLNISGVQGLTDAEIKMFIASGAVTESG